MAHDVFISYSSKDKIVADAACALLEARGIRCWMAPRDIVPGSEWGAAIIGAIGGSKVMVLIYTSSSNASPQVRREVERAVARGLHVIPFRVEDVPMSPALEYFISSPHWLDALNPPMERHLDHLGRIIKAVLDAQNAASPAVGDAASAAPSGAEPAGGSWMHGPPPGSFSPQQMQQQAGSGRAVPTAMPGRVSKRNLIIAGGVLAGVVVAIVVTVIVVKSGGKSERVVIAPANSGTDVKQPAPSPAPTPPADDPKPAVAAPVTPAPVIPAPTPSFVPRIFTPVTPPPAPAVAQEPTADDVKHFWDSLAQGNPRVGTLGTALDIFPKLADRKNAAGNTPLFEAAKAGQARVVALLLENHADRKLLSSGNNTALHGLALGGISDQALIEKIAPGSLDARNADGNTPLHVAIVAGNAETARLIADAGADVNLADKNGRTPLQLALSLDDPAKAHAAAVALVHAGAKTDVADKRGNTPVHLAAAAGDLPLLTAMFDKGAKLERPGQGGRTVLHIAIAGGRVDMVKALLARRVAVDTADDAGYTPLHLAATLKEPGIAEALLAAGAKVTTATTERQTPLHVAAAMGNAPLVELFMRNGGADVLTKGKPPSPIDVAEKAGKKDIVAMLRRLEFPSMLASAIRTPSQPVPVRLIEMIRKDPTLAEPTGADRQNALHLCAAAGNAAFAAELLKINPALAKAFSAAEETPLHVACANKQAAVVKVLLAGGASVRATTSNGDTPLHVAARAGAADVIKLLLDAGADPDVTNKTGTRAAEVAKDATIQKALVAAEQEANVVRNFWSSMQLDGHGFDVTGPGLTAPIRMRFRGRTGMRVEGDIGGAYKSFEGTYTKGSLTLALESPEGAIFPGIAGKTYSGKIVPGTDDSQFTLKVGNAEIQFTRR